MPAAIPHDKETPEILKGLLSRIRYEPESGRFFRISRRKKELRGCVNNRGYVILKLAVNKGYLAHRVAWALHHGEWPPIGMYVDHKNGNRTDNRIENLRVVSNSDNALNSKVRKRNTSGIPGVYKQTGTHKWIASLRGKHLIFTPCFAKAVAARLSAERAIGDFSRVHR